MKKTILGMLLTLSTLGLVSISYNNTPSLNIPENETNIPKLYYPSSLTELMISPELLNGHKTRETLASYRQPPRPKTKGIAYQLLNQSNVDHLLPNIDKSTFQTKYMKAGEYLLVNKATQEPLLQIDIGNKVNSSADNCSIITDSPMKTLDLNYLHSCTYQWLLAKPAQTYPSLLGEFTNLLATSPISRSSNTSSKRQCQEMLYTFGEYASDLYPLNELLAVKNSELCSSEQNLLRSLHTTIAHSSKGQPSDFNSIYNLCLASQQDKNTDSTALINCKSALARAIANYYYVDPSKAISICTETSALKEIEGTDQCSFLIYKEYFLQLRSLSKEVLATSTNPTLKKHLNYIQKLTPVKICIAANLTGCKKAANTLVDTKYRIYTRVF